MLSTFCGRRGDCCCSGFTHIFCAVLWPPKFVCSKVAGTRLGVNKLLRILNVKSLGVESVLIGICGFGKFLHAYCLLFACLYSQCCLHLLSSQDPTSMIPVMESIVFCLDKCKPLHFWTGVAWSGPSLKKAMLPALFDWESGRESKLEHWEVIRREMKE